MATNLRLLPVESDRGTSASSHTVLTLDEHPELFELIRKIKSRDMPEEFLSYCGELETGETSFWVTREDRYGEPIKYVRARDLVLCMEDSPFELSVRNKAVLYYLKMLNFDHKIALYWC